MSDRKIILVLYADAGFGHRTAANAVAAALQEKYAETCQVELINPLDDRRTPLMLRDSQADYDHMVRRLPEIYKLGYQASDASVPSTLVESGLILLLFEVMRDLVKRYHPDAIVTTYPLYMAPLDAVFTIGRTRTPLVTVVTDLATVHRLWFNDSVDYCLVPTARVYDLAIDAGLLPEQVHITGIPVSPDLVTETRLPEEIRIALGWRPDLTTLLAVGGRRVDGLTEALHVINHSGMPIQLVVVAGGDEVLYHQLQQMQWHAVTHLYNYAGNMPELLHAADLVMCKAGGLIITESLACGRPLLLIDAIPGQEKGNADYVVEAGAADLGQDPIAVLETLYHWLEHGGALLAQRAQAARALGRPQAAYEVADYAFAAAQRGPVRKSRRPTASGRDRLEGLLNTNKIEY
ncbi:MAG: glycosyltransferase [Anaerolineaceae bacterium]|nr:glycosyltransferase [Anaerolineaceae bacterium]